MANTVTQQSSVKRNTISISQIAPLICLDAYNNFPRITCEIWRRYDPIDFKMYEDKLKEQGYQIATSNEMNDIWEIDNALGTNILQQVKDVNSNKDKSSGEMVSNQETISKYINDNSKLASLDATQKQIIAKKVCSITNKMHGIINEDSIMAEFCRLSEKTIKDTQGWVEIQIDMWVIVGKYDGITTDNELVEAKMRQKALFKKIRDYENVQVQLYLHALKLEQAYLVESYTNKKNINTIYVNEVKYDKNYVTDIVLERISIFIKFFNVLMNKTLNSTHMKEGLLKGDKDRKIYNIYKHQYIGIEEIDF